jgi:hypothetical protein
MQKSPQNARFYDLSANDIRGDLALELTQAFSLDLF